MIFELREYMHEGRSPFARWFNKLSPVAAARVDKYLRRIAQGNLGTPSPLGAGFRS